MDTEKIKALTLNLCRVIDNAEDMCLGDVTVAVETFHKAFQATQRQHIKDYIDAQVQQGVDSIVDRTLKL